MPRSANTPRATARVETEIRIVATRHFFEFNHDPMRDFYSQAASLTLSQLIMTEKRVALQEQNAKLHQLLPARGVMRGDVGVRADPDVFSLVMTQPWLPYQRTKDGKVAFWTAFLPRDAVNVVTSPLTVPLGKRVFYPVLFHLDRAILDEEGQQELLQLQAGGQASDDDHSNSNNQAVTS
ncbi:hypothetical protein NDA11_007815 [Ustilago hordei]|uniref:Uncharacterized protein n=1 Tax=Ustilago hordei TaxID=120017 RepID=I2FXL6_USTHO|nr:uncharacterized protein UHO2_00106 [Ustilago hordei]KAJ1043569.1 hypothetical protein NDA10_002378 [Ustilago hordei]KAJ1571099.1 hypothetical protein NDA11_007815 [Ustilago hordei]KAJ1587488.1 hypothetical protein NDA15_005977 [Ustilago hordei]KAJ1589755.1 hypothetical protein NDA12_000564 [Ustilago hordei]KAJ1602094.1 hypothetical protein NDA14_001558 [Ustilago hordei]